jgi:hypothetical protein
MIEIKSPETVSWDVARFKKSNMAARTGSPARSLALPRTPALHRDAGAADSGAPGNNHAALQAHEPSNAIAISNFAISLDPESIFFIVNPKKNLVLPASPRRW